MGRTNVPTMVIARSGWIAGAIFSLAACTGSAPPEAAATGSTAPPPAVDAQVIVEVRLPDRQHGIIGPAEGRVLTEDGELVETFEFDSAWVIPDNLRYQESPPTSTGADPSITLSLPEPGTYRFELDSIIVSNMPCGTCEQVLDGVSIEMHVENGSMVELPTGETLAES